MRREAISHGFGSRVGQRVFLFFLIAACIPVFFTAFLTYEQTNRGLRDEAYANLRSSAKTSGMAIMTRLQHRELAALAILDQYIIAPGQQIAPPEFLRADFRAAWRIREGQSAEVLFGDEAIKFEYGRLDFDHLNAGSAQLIDVPSGANLRWLLVFNRPGADGAPRLNVFELDGEIVWKPQTDFNAQADYCVFTATGTAIDCTQPVKAESRSLLAAGVAGPIADVFEWSLDNVAMLSASWELFLQADFATGPVDIVTMVPRSQARKSVADFRSIFPQTIALVLLLVGTLSFVLIRRSLVPLRILTDATRSFSAGDLNERVSLKTKDEFKQLGDAFNHMASNLQEQIGAMQLLSEIDRQIMCQSPFEIIAENFLRNVCALLDCESGFILVRDPNANDRANLVSFTRPSIHNERIEIGPSDAKEWQATTSQIFVARADDDTAIAAILRRQGLQHGIWLPAVVAGTVKAIFVLASDQPISMNAQRRQHCLDFVSRLAVGVTSVEREEALYRRAHYDELTGLPNRQLMKDRLYQALQKAQRDGIIGALLFLDLDRFKTINDVFGHTAGDSVLIQTAARLQSVVREVDTVARLGGDEFVILAAELSDKRSVREVAARVLSKLALPFSVAGSEHYLSVSIGIVLFPEDGDSVEALLKNADTAMYRAKDSGRSRYEFFSEKLDAESRRKLLLERDLKRTLHSGGLQLHYQPQFVLKSGELRGAEALLRWKHDTLGPISPAEFIGIAEESDLILDIGLWVLNQACADLRYLLDAGMHPGPISVNVSARQLGNSGFSNEVVRVLRDHRISPSYLEIEITETIIAQNRDTAIDALSQLKGVGVHIAMDDFGTGYSSLSYLQQLPFDVLKIDQSFVRQIGDESSGDGICRAIITMAHELGKSVIAEGVETNLQADFLSRHRCEFAQGYYYSKPLSQADFFAFISNQGQHTQRRRALEVC